MGLEKFDPCDANCNGRVYTWGDNEYYWGGYGKLGIGDEQSWAVNTPVQVHGPNNVGVLENIVAIGAGWEHRGQISSAPSRHMKLTQWRVRVSLHIMKR